MISTALSRRLLLLLPLTTHEVAQDIAHILFDLLGIFAGFQSFDGYIHLFGHGAWRQDLLHLAHHVRHVPGIVFIEVLHILFHLAHGAHHSLPRRG